MDAVHELAEQSSDEMREEIDCTRSDLADKMEALEDSVMGTVQSAQETVEDGIQMAKDTMATVKRTFDIKHHVQQHPWAMVGGCFVTGLALGALFRSVDRRLRQSPDELSERETAIATSPALPGEQSGNKSFATGGSQQHEPSRPPSRPGLFELFHDEIVKVKGMAIGYVMGLARDAISDAVPQWAPQIDGVMNSVTTKLGGEPAQRHSNQARS
jgi:ElaB/YqjD/DUF883 family membrane-anchored ribosome-binding protein